MTSADGTNQLTLTPRESLASLPMTRRKVPSC